MVINMDVEMLAREYLSYHLLHIIHAKLEFARRVRLDLEV